MASAERKSTGSRLDAENCYNFLGNVDLVMASLFKRILRFHNILSLNDLDSLWLFQCL
jgi:hypothetical protein